MKSAIFLTLVFAADRSPPARGAWIEMPTPYTGVSMAERSPPARGAWIEMPTPYTGVSMAERSPPARGAWIEIFAFTCYRKAEPCRPPHGGRGLK